MMVYLAGPEVFLPDAIAVGDRKREICARHGLIGRFPLDKTVPPDSPTLSLDIFRANTGLMQECDAIIANLTPFRSPSADVGTVYELGFMIGRSKACAGYSNVPGSYLSKVRHEGWAGAGEATDRDRRAIEDFGLADNLMIVHALDVYGLPLVVPKARVADPLRDLAAFEACVRQLAAHAHAAAHGHRDAR
jgi:nucleoside 2-deoxyribosyltransferase